MTVICNATPLINFAGINRLDLLQSIFQKVIIPQAVYQETTQSNFPSSSLIINAIKQENWLQVKQVDLIPKDISYLLDAGEREVITLALSLNENKVLLDEQEARKVAQTFKLKIIGTLGILILAKKNNLISEVKPLLDNMIKNSQYWVNKSLYKQVLKSVNEI